MTDEPESQTLRLLREIRSEVREGFTKVFDDLAEMRGSVSELQVAVAAIRADQGRANEVLEHHSEILGRLADTQANQGARLNAIDGRLALIERHTGMVKA